MRLVSLGLVLLLAASASGASASRAEPGSRAEQLVEKGGGKKRLSDGQIKKILIDESIAAYEGNCPCPYNRASNGSRCGRRSAYSREGGAAPLCFPADVTAEMVQAYRDEHPEE